jgi:hypothetical protein
MRATTFDPTKAPWNVAEGEEPCAVLYVDWPSGAEYYGQRAWSSGGITVIERVVEWGTINVRATDMEPGGVGLSGLQGTVPRVTVALRDDDLDLWKKCRDDDAIQGRTARVYLAAHGEQVDYFKVFEGVVSEPPTWARGQLRLSLSSGDLHLHEEVGNLADVDTFDNVYPPHAGRMLPIVFGQALRVPAVAVQHGREGRFRADADEDDTTLYIEGWGDLDSDVTVILHSGMERMSGTFKGSRFTTETRGGGTIASGTTVSASDKDEPTYINVDTADLGTDEAAYHGYLLKMTVPGSPSAAQVGYEWLASSALGHQMFYHLRDNKAGAEYRHIYRYDATNGVLRFAPAFTFEKNDVEDEGRFLTVGENLITGGNVWIPPNNESYEITTMARAHSKGERVWEVISGGTVYIAADHAVQAVRAVYARGRKREIPVPRRRPELTITLGGGGAAVEGLDATAGQIGPQQNTGDGWIMIPPDMYTVNTNDSTTFPGLGRAVTTITFAVPVPNLPRFEFDGPDIMVDIEGYQDGATLVENPVDALKHLLDDWASNVPTNAASFTSAAASVDWVDCAFGLTERTPAQRLAAEIAFQSRCRATWKDGEIHVDYLRNSAPSVFDLTINDEYEEGSHEMGWRGLNSLATEFRYKLRVRGEVKEFVEEDANSIANVRLRTPLTSLRAEVGDWVKLWSYEFFGDYQGMELIGVANDPGSGAARTRSPSVFLELAAPYGWDDRACPAGDTCVGCELYCEVAADVLPCVVAADLGCDVFDLDGHAGWAWNRPDELF